MNFENIFNNKNSTLIFQVVVGIVLGLISFLVFAKLADTVFEKERIIFDSYVINYVYSFRNPLNSKIMIIITDFGFYGIGILSGLITLLLFLKKKIKLSMYFAFVVGSGFVANALLKLLIQRPRPSYLPLITETDFSFPSGHAMSSFIFFVTVTYLYYHLTMKKNASIFLLFVFMLLTFFIGVSRIYLGVHYPSDILGGIVAGFLWFVGITTASKIYKLFKVSK